MHSRAGVGHIVSDGMQGVCLAASGHADIDGRAAHLLAKYGVRGGHGHPPAPRKRSPHRRGGCTRAHTRQADGSSVRVCGRCARRVSTATHPLRRVARSAVVGSPPRGRRCSCESGSGHPARCSVRRCRSSWWCRRRDSRGRVRLSSSAASYGPNDMLQDSTASVITQASDVLRLVDDHFALTPQPGARHEFTTNGPRRLPSALVL